MKLITKILAIFLTVLAMQNSVANDLPAQQYDFYLLATQWMPGWCQLPNAAKSASAVVNEQYCSRSNNGSPIVYHGLWPENNDGSYPQFCESAPELDKRLLIFNNPYKKYLTNYDEFIDHEWSKHGTCTNYSLEPNYYFGVNEYFITGLSLFNSISWPEMVNITSLDELKSKINSQNKDVPIDSMFLSCSADTDQHLHLTGIWFCVNKKSLKFESCSPEIIQNSCSAEDVIIDKFTE